jgi:hypothetical protein
MNPKKRLVALTVLLAIASAVLPGAASAGGWDIDPQGGKFPLSFTISGGLTRWSTSSTILECTSVTGTGHYETATTGKLEISLHGCAAPNFTCTSAGQTSGTVTTSELEFHNVFLESDKSKLGMLITAKEGRIATFTCNGIGMEISGNGVLSQMTAPKCGETSTTNTELFEASSPGNQKWTQVETAGTTYDLSWTLGGTMAFLGSTTFTFAEKATVTC